MDKAEKRSIAKKKITATSKRLFYENGYSSITMDDIARDLKMSKKTIYKYYKSKYDLLLAIIEDFKLNLSSGVENIINDDSLVFNEKLEKMINFSAVFLSQVSPVFVNDIKTNLPKVWKSLSEYRNEAAFKRFRKLIDEGVSNNYIDKDKNVFVIIALYRCIIDYLIDPEFLGQFPQELRDNLPEKPSDMFDSATKIIIEGILAK